jgi:hypothetical protein
LHGGEVAFDFRIKPVTECPGFGSLIVAKTHDFGIHQSKIGLFGVAEIQISRRSPQIAWVEWVDQVQLSRKHRFSSWRSK